MKYIIPAMLIALLTFVGTQAKDISSKKTMNKTIEIQTKSDKEAIKELMLNLFEETDNRNWEAVKALMAEKVQTDYTALGGQATVQTPDEILEGWKALLPGFDRTIHQAHNFAIWVAGDRATATLDAIALHYLQNESGDNDWTVFVGYDTEFVKENDQWKLARIDLSLYQQKGNTQLPGLAMQRVKEGKVQDFAERSEATSSVENFFLALENTDLEAFLDNLDRDVVQEMPLAPTDFPKSLKGIAAMRQQYSGVMAYTQQYERTFSPTQNPRVLLAKFQGKIITEAGKGYNNSYVGVYEVNEEGKVVHFKEYFNPNILLNSWTGLQPETYSMHASGAKTKEGVGLRDVSFSSQGNRLQGHLFLPPNYDESQRYPAVIVTGSWTSVKEQMPDTYASQLAQNGFVALTFDFRGFGESEGQPRQVEDYQLKIEDIQAATEFLSQHPSVNAKDLTALGICASAGYMAHATARDARIQKLVLLAPWLHNPAIAREIYDLRPGGTDGLLQAAKEAKSSYGETGEMSYVLAASELDPLSAMYVPNNVFDYYLNPGKAAGAAYDNRFAVSSWEPWLTFDGISAGENIDQPVFIVHSESGAVPQGAKAFYEKLQGEKEIVWLNEFNQQQLYFEEEAVNSALNQIVNYLKK